MALLLIMGPLISCGGGASGADGRAVESSAVESGAGSSDAALSRETLPGDSVWLANAWMRAGAAGATTGAYAVIYNTRADSISIIGAVSEAADTVEVHESVQHDGMVHMEPQRLLTIPAGDSMVFAPGGKHFMVRSLQRALVAGETVTVRVLLSDGTSLDVPFAVRPIGG